MLLTEGIDSHERGKAELKLVAASLYSGKTERLTIMLWYRKVYLYSEYAVGSFISGAFQHR